ncbi:MAG: VCBS repeat-containing protein [Calditrichota bacterium]
MNLRLFVMLVVAIGCFPINAQLRFEKIRIDTQTRPIAFTFTYDVFMEDVDGDGDQDVLTASAFNNMIAWHEQLGSGQYVPRLVDTLASGAFGVHAVDMDNDGDMDVLSALRDSNQVA